MVSDGPIGILTVRRIGPESTSGSTSMMVTPVSTSPSKMALATGAGRAVPGEEGGVDVEGAVGREGEGPVGEDKAVGGYDYDVGAEGFQIRPGFLGGQGLRLEDGED